MFRHKGESVNEEPRYSIGHLLAMWGVFLRDNATWPADWTSDDVVVAFLKWLASFSYCGETHVSAGDPPEHCGSDHT